MKTKRRTLVFLAALSFSLASLAVSGSSLAKGLPNLNWVLQTTETSLQGAYVSEWVEFGKAVKDRTDGKFDIHVALAKELGIGRREIPRAVGAGQIEIGFLMASVAEGDFPYLGVFNLPYLTRDQDDVLRLESAIHKQVEKSFAAAGYKTLTPDAVFVWPPQDLLSRAPIDNLSDLNGLKVRVWREPDAKLISSLGGTPVYMPVEEAYPAMQRGVVDALNTGPQAMVNSSMWEVGKSYYAVSLEPSATWIIINSEAWENLPEEYKEILKEEGGKAMGRLHDKWAKTAGKQRAILTEHGVEVFQPTESDRKAWTDAARPIWESWAEKDKNKLDVLNTARELLD